MRLKIITSVVGVALLAGATGASAGAFGYRGGGFNGGIGLGGPGVVIGTPGYRDGAYDDSYEYGYNDPAYDNGDGVVTGRSAADDYDLQGPLD